MTAKVIFNWLIGIFGALSLSGVAMGLYSVFQDFYLADSKNLGSIGFWLFAGCGVAFLICLAVRITLGIVG